MTIEIDFDAPDATPEPTELVAMHIQQYFVGVTDDQAYEVADIIDGDNLIKSFDEYYKA